MNFKDNFKCMESGDGSVTGVIKSYHCRPCNFDKGKSKRT